MATSQRILGVMFVLLWNGNIARGDPDTSATSATYNQVKYQASDPFAYSLSYVLSALKTMTPNHPGYNYFITSPYPEALAYGHAFCNQGLSYPDCATCVSYVKAHLLNNCPSSIGAQLVLQDCRLRYEQYPFTD